MKVNREVAKKILLGFESNVRKWLGKPKNEECVKVCPVGSFYLDLMTPSSDIDLVLCISKPVVWKAKKSDFQKSDVRSFYTYVFTQVSFLLMEIVDDQIELEKKKKEIDSENKSRIRVVGESIIPVVKMKVKGIEIDLMISLVPVDNIVLEKHIYVPKQIFEEIKRSKKVSFSHNKMKIELNKIDEKSFMVLNGTVGSFFVRNILKEKKIDFEKFRKAHDMILHWAKVRMIYSGVFCYFPGFGLRSLLFYLVKKYSSDPKEFDYLSFVKLFFDTFSSWDWSSKSVVLHGNDNLISKCKNRKNNMFIFTPSNEQIIRNMTRSSYELIVNELKRGKEIFQSTGSSKSTQELSKRVDFFGKCKMVVRVSVISKNESLFLDLQEYVKSRIVKLVFKLESLHDDLIVLPYPKHFPSKSKACRSNIFLKIASKKKIKEKIDVKIKCEEFCSEVKNWTGWRKEYGIRTKFVSPKNPNLYY